MLDIFLAWLDCVYISGKDGWLVGFCLVLVQNNDTHGRGDVMFVNKCRTLGH